MLTHLVPVLAAALVGGVVARGADVLATTGPWWHDPTPSRVPEPVPVAPAGTATPSAATAITRSDTTGTSRPRRAVGAPLPEVAGALLGAGLVARIGLDADLPVWAWCAAVGVLLTIIDARRQLLPTRVLAPATAVSLGLLTVAAAVGGDWSALGRAAAAGAVTFLVVLVMVLAVPTGLYMGDVRLAGFLGLNLGWLSWPAVLAGLLLGFVLQAVLALGLLAARRVGLRSELPFGPALIAGTLAVALLQGS